MARLVIALFLVLGSAYLSMAEDLYTVGVGIGDTTGPAADITLMGYGKSGQTSQGIHTRTYARAFIIEQSGNAVVYVNVDSGMAFSSVKLAVARELKGKFNDMYHYDNIMISATHTHSTPAGSSFFALYSVSAYGFVYETYSAQVKGVVSAISMAHERRQENTRIRLNEGKLTDANWNRSPLAYLENPESERAQYPDGDRDLNMILMRFEAQDKTPVGMLNWFSVHGTCIKPDNRLISSDNKGYAEYMFERMYNGPTTIPGMGGFVGAFSQTSEGDSSPDTSGASCPDGSECDGVTSTCGGNPQLCKSSGPGKDQWESAAIIGQKQVDKAKELFEDEAAPALSGPVFAASTTVSMEGLLVDGKYSQSGKPEHLCTAAYGYGFAAGTVDGFTPFDFIHQGQKSTNPFLKIVSNLLSKPDKKQIECQADKPILLNLGKMKGHTGLNWVPKVLPVQVMRVGKLAIIGAPFEISTMAGRRLRNSVREALIESGVEDPTVVIAGLANAYAGYTTTPEEYKMQRYEGASTLWGPNQLPALQQEFSKVAIHAAKGTHPPAGPEMEDLLKHVITIFVPPVVFDSGNAGKVLQQPKASYSQGDAVTAVFQTANPRSNKDSLKHFLEIQMKENGIWKTVATEANWETFFHWEREGLAASKATMTWSIPPDTPAGTYRMVHRGMKKGFAGMKDFDGATNEFTVTGDMSPWDVHHFYPAPAAAVRASATIV